MAKNPNSTQQERKAQKQERKLAAKKEELKKSRKNKAIFIGIIAVLAAFAALLVYHKISTGGWKERHTVVASTENYEVSQAMMTYYFNTLYSSFASSYSSDQDNYKSFVEDVNNHGSNYDFIMSYAKQQVEQALTLCEMAKEAGVELDSADLAEIDAAIESYDETRVSSGNSIMNLDTFIEAYFGKAVDESVLRECLKLSQLASKYQEEVTEAMTYSDEDCQAYYEEHIDDYNYVDYLTYTFTKPAETTDTTDTTADTTDTTADTTDTTDTTADTTDTTDTTADTADTTDTTADTTDTTDTAADTADTTEAPAADDSANEAKTLAEELAATKSVDEFNEYMTDYLTKEAEKDLTEDETEVDAEAVKTQVEGLAKTKQLKSSITDEDAKAWAFADTTKVGDTYIVSDDEAGSYIVYMISATAYRDEELTRSAAVLTLSDSNYDGDSSAKAEEIKAEWDESDKTEEAFEELCEKYSESSHHHVEEGYTKSNAGDLADWLFGEDIKVGDVGIVHSDSNAATYIA